MVYFSEAQYYYLHKMLGVRTRVYVSSCVFKFRVCEFYRSVRLEIIKFVYFFL